MEPRVIIVVAALALFVVILIGFLVAVVRSVRKHEEELEPVQTLGDWPALPPAPERIVDTNLDGLELDIPADSPSSRLLTPLRVGSWQPPIEPAPGARLGEVSLARRIASFQPPPAARHEPRFAPTAPLEALLPRTPPAASMPVPAHSALAAGLAAAASDRPGGAVPVSPAQPATLPSVAAVLPQAAIPAAPQPVVDQSAEQTGVLPRVAREVPSFELSPPEIAPVGAVVVGLGAAEAASAVEEPTVPASPPRPAIIVPEVIQPAPAVESSVPDALTAVAAVEPAALPVAGPVSPERAREEPPIPAAAEQPLAPVPAPAAHEPVVPAPAAQPPAVMEPAAAEWPTAELAPAPAPPDSTWPTEAVPVAGVPTPDVQRVAPPTPAPAAAAPIATPAPAAILTPTPAPPTPERPRPAVVVHAPRPEVVEVPELPRAETPRPRPRTHVRGNLDSVLPVEYESAVQPSPLRTLLQGAMSRSQAPDLILAAPVEMWFGDARVGVKAGTRTYAQFRKYADVLLDGLKET